VYFKLLETERQQNQSNFLVCGRKTNWHGFDYKLCKSSVACTDCNRDLSSAYRHEASFSPTCRHILSQTVGVNSDSDFLLSVTKRPSDVILHFSWTHVGIWLVAWNSITSDFRKRERIQRRFVSLSTSLSQSHRIKLW